MPRAPINYKNTIIYKIVCKDLNIKDIYVGSTTSFKDRKREHKSRCKNNYPYKLYTIINDNGGWDNWDMIEIEKYECNDANEARARERYNYEELNAKLNSRCPTLDIDNEKIKNTIRCKEWNDKNKHLRKEKRENNKDEINKKKREWYFKNKDIINEKRRLKKG